MVILGDLFYGLLGLGEISVECGGFGGRGYDRNSIIYLSCAAQGLILIAGFQVMEVHGFSFLPLFLL